MTRAVPFLLAAALATRADAQTYLVVISGLSGEPSYSAAFHTTATQLIDAARDRFGISDSRITYLAERTDLGSTRIDARSTKTDVRRVFADLAETAERDALILVVLLGHGSETGGTPRINLPGRDLSASELAEALAPFTTQQVVVANTTSASGGWIRALSGPRRTIITATRSGAERDEARFATHFVRALAENGADTDRNGRVSVLEAFDYARHEVRRAYETANQLVTEHALLDDNGDGRGTLEPSPLDGDGAAAARLYLDGAGRATSAADPVLATLLHRRDSLEQALDGLRARQSSLPAGEYDTALERLLLEIARVGRAIRDHDAGRDP